MVLSKKNQEVKRPIGENRIAHENQHSFRKALVGSEHILNLPIIFKGKLNEADEV